jgi:NAD(P)-dependent dehydrogenase (short-subunit alcohol dehydrogenase family)
MTRLQDKVALVTGAARGIGAAVAARFAREGATVIITDVSDTAGVEVARSLGPPAWYRHLDVREEWNWESVLAEVLERHGRLDVVVNNAGITGLEEDGPPQNPEAVELATWRAVLATNLDGVMLGCKHAIRAMRPAGRGAIVNIASRSGMVGIPGAVAYAASKAAVLNHTRSVALYCAGQGMTIRCNAVVPAAILTPMWEPLLGEGAEREQRMRALVADTPLGRFGTPEEVAAAVLYLASDESGYTTGAELVLDGGLLAGAAATPKPR